VADALIATEGSKALSGLSRNVVGNPCPKAAAADTLYPLREFLVQAAFAIAEAEAAPCRVFPASTIAYNRLQFRLF
jgi:hypothetical protein